MNSAGRRGLAHVLAFQAALAVRLGAPMASFDGIAVGRAAFARATLATGSDLLLP